MPRGRPLQDAKRQAILQAARRVFREDGFLSASMDRVAERANVSKRTIYNHFENKDALFDAIVQEFWDGMADLDDAPPSRDISVDARLKELARARLHALLEPDIIGMFRAVLGESLRAPALERSYRSQRGTLEMLGIGPLLEEEAARGRLRIPQPGLAAAHFWGLVLDPLFWPLLLGLRGPPTDDEIALIIDEGVTTFLARYGAPTRSNA